MTDIEAVVFSPSDIAAAIRRMAVAVARDYVGSTVVLLGVLKGALFVTADLARDISAVAGTSVEVQLDFLAVSSYGNAHRSSGEVRLVQDTSHSIEGKHVLVVEDIVDNGHHALVSCGRCCSAARRPLSLRSAVLLRQALSTVRVKCAKR